MEREVCGFKIVAVSGDDMMVNATDLLLTTTAQRVNIVFMAFTPSWIVIYLYMAEHTR